MSRQHRVSLTDLINNDVAPAVQAAVSAPIEPVVSPPSAVAPIEAATVSPAAPAAPAAIVQKPVAARAPRGATLRARSKQLSLYLEEPVYEELRSLAFSERSKMHQLIVEGIDLMLRKRGHPSIKYLMKRAQAGR